MGESVTEGVILEWHKQPGDAVEEDETIVEISTDKVDAEVPAPAAGTITEILAEAGDTVTVGQVSRACAAGDGAQPPPRPRRSPPRRPAAGRPASRRRAPDGTKATPVAHRVAAAEGVDLAAIAGTRPGGRITKADVLAAADGGNGAPAARPRPGRGATPHQGRRGDARPLHGRVALDPDRDLVPHDHRHDARRPPQAAQGRPARRSPSRT